MVRADLLCLLVIVGVEAVCGLPAKRDLTQNDHSPKHQRAQALCSKLCTQRDSDRDHLRVLAINTCGNCNAKRYHVSEGSRDEEACPYWCQPYRKGEFFKRGIDDLRVKLTPLEFEKPCEPIMA
ncbi:hypothetical protein CAPTEDRAFT_201994 [Capitella teleta]|uniref:Secreted protein n=1 Tax=Capitella teleta TaxID=283909 RepID=R7TGH8_CAPTE|nr:hypothetical protein CAPTEDRAFT_201994 [Capitella teleta]|eukprot:ELT90220.1 hypothetical protein CAPTEDRAFT_201994 [Capitella teleta]